MKKRILITGATSGIGLKTAEKLAGLGHDLILGCRNMIRAVEIKDHIKKTYNVGVTILEIDMASFDSIKTFVCEFNKHYAYLDVLINNAGAFFDKKHFSENGYEMTMAVNYLGQVLLTEGLLPALKTEENARIINICSKAAFSGKLNVSENMFISQAPNFKAYSASKLAQLMYTIYMANKLKDDHITVNAVHPGHVDTNIWKGDTLLMKVIAPMMKKKSDSADLAALTPVYLALSPDVQYKTGKMFEKESHIMALPNKKLMAKDIDVFMKLTYKILNL